MATTEIDDQGDPLFDSMESVLDALRVRVPAFPADFERRLDERRSDLLSHAQLQVLVMACQGFVPDVSRDALLEGATGRDLVSWLRRAVAPTDAHLDSGPRGTYRGTSTTLRPVAEVDVAGLYLSALHPANAHRWRCRGEAPPPDAFRRALFSESVLAQFMVVPRDDQGHGIGLVNAYSADLTSGNCYLAFQRSGPPGTGRARGTSGMMIEGIALFIEYLFDHFDLHKIYAELPEYNLGLLDGLVGTLFVEEGRLVGHYRYAERRWDLHILALYRPAWEELIQRFRPGWDGRD